MNKYEKSIIGYCLLKQDPLPILKLKGKFSEVCLNQIASISSIGVFDLVNISEKIEKLGIKINIGELISAMNTSIITELSIDSYIKKVEEEYFLNQAKRVIGEIHGNEISKETIADLIKNLSSLESVAYEDPTIEKAIEEFKCIQEQFVIAHSEGKSIVGNSTGYYELDKITDGIQDHHLWVIAAYTSTGKTTFALNIVRELLNKNIPVVFYSLEMSRSELYVKLIAMESNLGTWKLKRSGVNQEDYEKYKEAREKSKNWKLKIYDKKTDIQDIIVSMKEESMRGGKVFVIDYLQNISDKRASNEYELITNAIHDIQNTTIALPISTLLVSQISNEDSKNTNILNVNAKGSGGVRAAADIFLYIRNTLKEEELLAKYDNGEKIPMQVVISKNRHGRIGLVNVERSQNNGIIYESIPV